MHRLQAVPDVGQGTADDDGHGVVDVRRAHLLRNVDFNDSVLFKYHISSIFSYRFLLSVYTLQRYIFYFIPPSHFSVFFHKMPFFFDFRFFAVKCPIRALSLSHALENGFPAIRPENGSAVTPARGTSNTARSALICQRSA